MKTPARKSAPARITDKARLDWLSKVSATKQVTFFHPPGNESVRAAIDRQICASRAQA